MQDPNTVSPGYNGSHLNFDSAPAADMSWDDLFPPTESAPQAPVVPAPVTPQAPVTQSQPFLKAGETVYLTPEAAVEGTIHKDEYIRRARVALQENGIDPNKFERIQQVQTPQAPSTTPNPNGFEFYGQGQKYFDALANAVDRKDRVAYEAITRKYNDEALRSNLAPLGPLIAEVARSRAIRQVAQEIPDFPKFVDSPEFKTTLDKNPLLRDLAQIGESDPNAAGRLADVYRTAYLTYRGSTPFTPSAPQAPIVPPVNSTPTVRQVPTMTQSTLTPPNPAPDTRNWTTDREARKQLIQDGNARGINVTDWEKLGL